MPVKKRRYFHIKIRKPLQIRWCPFLGGQNLLSKADTKSPVQKRALPTNELETAKGRWFFGEPLTEMYRSMQDTLDGQYELTDKQENLISDTCEKIENTVPDLRQRIAQAEEVSHNFEQTM